MLRIVLGICYMALFLIVAPGSAAAQFTNPSLRVFLECQICDFDLVRTDISYVDWMRDRADADLHIIARFERTGGGGLRHTLDFLGLQRHLGKADTLTYFSGRDDSQDVMRRGLNRVLQIGLMRYVADTDIASRVEIEVADPPEGTTSTAEARAADPWNAWVFSVGGSGFMIGESTRTQTSINANLGANRVTAAWKLNFSGRGSYGRQSFTYTPSGSERDTTTVSINRSYFGNGLIVRSLTGHTSFGGRVTVGTSTFGNTELSIDVQPAIEYNLFPYSESTRRQLLVQYGAGMQSQRYREETVYFLMDETRGIHSFLTDFTTRQQWGSFNIGINGRQYLHDTSLYNLGVDGGASVNVTRGLSVNVSGRYSMIRDQISLARRNLTAEEVLLRQRQAATNFSYITQVGLTYRFGSSVQNVVNPRFGGGF